ncbi:isoprenylcysteine carboxylmethyltransferase family protein [Yinghuangia aomiensis]|uniref:Isoprenylcysteine carboxylmethyltransferase family protein n=1 Tax=Yinghuangia aomiensis TaxID=676205 RepID=A0ABP9HBL1_9ACTN
MRKISAAAGSSLFFAVAPGVVAGVVPWALTGWRAGHADGAWWLVRGPAAVMPAAAGAVLVHAFGRFVADGSGTPAPVAPTAHLVVGGLYRYVRNPMYLAVVAVVVGQAALLWRPVLLGYAAGLCVLFAAFVRGYEERTLSRQFGAEYDEYKASVPAWLPRRPAAKP